MKVDLRLVSLQNAKAYFIDYNDKTQVGKNNDLTDTLGSGNCGTLFHP